MSELSCAIKKFWSADLSKSLSVKTLPSWKSTNLASDGVTLLIKIATPLPGAELNVTTLPDTENNAVSTLSK